MFEGQFCWVQGSRLTLLFLSAVRALAASGPMVSDEKPAVASGRSFCVMCDRHNSALRQGVCWAASLWVYLTWSVMSSLGVWINVSTLTGKVLTLFFKYSSCPLPLLPSFWDLPQRPRVCQWPPWAFWGSLIFLLSLFSVFQNGSFQLIHLWVHRLMPALIYC